MENTETIINKAQALQQETVSLRRHLHRHPELSFQEDKTSGFVADKLTELGYKVRKGIGKTGVVADLSQGNAVAIRAELDALAINENNRTTYSSDTAGVMHACGHDANMACVLTAAKLLMLDKPEGNIRILMQPAAEESCDEEGKAGTVRMIEDGALQDVSCIIALHLDATIAAGKVGIIAEPPQVAADSFKITIHSVRQESENSQDALYIANLVASKIYDICKRNHEENRGATLKLASIQSSSSNVDQLSDKVELQGTLSVQSKEIRRALVSDLEQACQTAKSMGADFDIEYRLLRQGATNSPEISELLREVSCELIGTENVLTVKRKTWTEDFASFTHVVPGALILLGGEIASNRRSHHSPTFDIDESGLYIGAAILAEAARRLCTR
jgi:amidohydrolase